MWGETQSGHFRARDRHGRELPRALDGTGSIRAATPFRGKNRSLHLEVGGPSVEKILSRFRANLPRILDLSSLFGWRGGEGFVVEALSLFGGRAWRFSRGYAARFAKLVSCLMFLMEGIRGEIVGRRERRIKGVGSSGDLRFNFTLGCLRSVFFFGNLAFLVARV